ncbi:MAG: SprT-like domain-containing protein [Bacteroidales bacterium]|nr:SprT-like domain-containing protein [Bacteroidales bacterium]MCM1147675.1 SprT-like domain-containing protein [Bacteroidales bacterium]MCM1206797.1 SprT-like domain-containing protein [Bacillota bacterium]MCM1510697.1 SprT-like domain-containing protein [Clostridium sp.]
MIATVPYIQQKFQEYNTLMFNGKLPELTIRLSKARTLLGQLAFKRKRTWYGRVVHYDFRLRISVRFDLPEDELDDVIIHEMIHYYIIVNKLKDKSAHGPLFRKMMKAINTQYGRNMSISRKKNELKTAETI